MGLRAKTNGGAQGLARQHVRAVQLTIDHAVEQHLPVGLRLERYVQTLVLEIALFVGDGERGHVGQLDEAEFEIFFLELKGLGRDRAGREQCDADHGGAELARRRQYRCGTGHLDPHLGTSY